MCLVRQLEFTCSFFSEDITEESRVVILMYYCEMSPNQSYIDYIFGTLDISSTKHFREALALGRKL